MNQPACASYNLTDPGIDVDFGAPQAQGRFTAHRHQVLALATVEAAIFDRPHLVRIATIEHLGHQAMVVSRLVASIGVGEPVPVLGKNLLEDVPVPRRRYKHQGAPRWRVEMIVVKRLSHTSPAQSTPSAVFMGHPHSLHCP